MSIEILNTVFDGAACVLAMADPVVEAGGEAVTGGGYGGNGNGVPAAEPFSFQVVVTAVLLMMGTLLCAISGIGMLRMPDVYMRMQAAAKAGTLGVSCILAAAASNFIGMPGAWGVTVEALLVIVFIFLTTPSAAHLIARAAYVSDAPKWHGTGRDDLRACYRGASGEILSSPDGAAAS